MLAGVIVGARDARYLPHTVAAAALALDDGDLRTLQAVLDEAPGVAGDVYELERVKGGRHAGIMKYDLNARTGNGDQGSGTGERGQGSGLSRDRMAPR